MYNFENLFRYMMTLSINFYNLILGRQPMMYQCVYNNFYCLPIIEIQANSVDTINLFTYPEVAVEILVSVRTKTLYFIQVVSYISIIVLY